MYFSLEEDQNQSTNHIDMQLRKSKGEDQLEHGF